MRAAFIDTLCALAGEDDRIWLLCGDLGFSVLEPFASRFPDRFVNAGVAEQNMTGLAAGIAMTGGIVFTYSIANFPVLRCLEQIRNDVCYHNANVKVVAVGGGLAYGSQGYTHHGVEDLGVMRILPHMAVIAPGDPVEARLATRAMAAYEGPAYLRLGKAREPVVHESDPVFELGKAIMMREGRDVAIFSTGTMLHTAVEGASELESRGYSVHLASMPFLHPFDREAVLQAARHVKHIITVEEHGPGGLSSAVAEVLAEHGSPARLAPLRLRQEALKHAGSQEELRAEQGLSVEGLVRCALKLLR